MSDIIEVSGQYYIRANASMADMGSRVLKNGDTFAIFDRHGDIRPFLDMGGRGGGSPPRAWGHHCVTTPISPFSAA